MTCDFSRYLWCQLHWESAFCLPRKSELGLKSVPRRCEWNAPKTGDFPSGKSDLFIFPTRKSEFLSSCYKWSTTLKAHYIYLGNQNSVWWFKLFFLYVNTTFTLISLELQALHEWLISWYFFTVWPVIHIETHQKYLFLESPSTAFSPSFYVCKPCDCVATQKPLLLSAIDNCSSIFRLHF